MMSVLHAGQPAMAHGAVRPRTTSRCRSRPDEDPGVVFRAAAGEVFECGQWHHAASLWSIHGMISWVRRLSAPSKSVQIEGGVASSRRGTGLGRSTSYADHGRVGGKSRGPDR